MPKLHRYFGSAATTWIFNRIYGTHYSDIHSGMRAMSLDALRRMNLQSQGWEYASEMILKAQRLGFRSTEVPIRFYKDREGPGEPLEARGWTAPWKAGWDSLRVMLLYAPGVLPPYARLVLLPRGPRHLLGHRVRARSRSSASASVSTGCCSAWFWRWWDTARSNSRRWRGFTTTTNRSGPSEH